MDFFSKNVISNGSALFVKRLSNQNVSVVTCVNYTVRARSCKSSFASSYPASVGRVTW